MPAKTPLPLSYEGGNPVGVVIASQQARWTLLG
jgi:hypothetical protein